MTVALYPGSFDPVTNGHIDIARRAASIFDRVIVGIYDKPAKNIMFNAEERVDMMSKALAGLSNASAQRFTGLTVDFARELGAKVIVRGLRASADFEYEFEMALMNRKLSPNIEVVCLMTSLEYLFLSASLLKEVAELGGEIQNMVPQHVASALRKKLLR
ncbi:MAG: pantetheine-phosphate adenylyltransferase [Chloroflexota bacterium]